MAELADFEGLINEVILVTLPKSFCVILLMGQVKKWEWWVLHSPNQEAGLERGKKASSKKINEIKL